MCITKFVFCQLVSHVQTMLLEEFYTPVISHEAAAVHFLQNNALLGDTDNYDPCHKCGGEMADKRPKQRNGKWCSMLRCMKKSCQTTQSVRTGNRFIHYTDLSGWMNSKLTLTETLELVYLVHSGHVTSPSCKWAPNYSACLPIPSGSNMAS